MPGFNDQNVLPRLFSTLVSFTQISSFCCFYRFSFTMSMTPWFLCHVAPHSTVAPTCPHSPWVGMKGASTCWNFTFLCGFRPQPTLRQGFCFGCLYSLRSCSSICFIWKHYIYCNIKRPLLLRCLQSWSSPCQPLCWCLPGVTQYVLGFLIPTCTRYNTVMFLPPSSVSSEEYLG